MTDSEVDIVLERFDKTEPALQRKIVAKLVMTVESLKADLAGSHDPMGDLIQANKDEILAKHEEAVRRVRVCLDAGCVDHAIKILDALAMFHPMHADSWKGWPKENL